MNVIAILIMIWFPFIILCNMGPYLQALEETLLSFWI